MFQFIEDISAIRRELRNLLAYSASDKRHFDLLHKQTHQQNEAIMSKATEAVDRLVELARPVIGQVKSLTEALRASNEREAALKAELAEFRSLDATEDAAQAAAQDKELADHADQRAAELSAEIAATQAAPTEDEDDAPAPAPEPAPETPEPAVDPAVETPEPRTDQAVGTEDATVTVVEEAPNGTDENGAPLGAGDPAVVTPEVIADPNA